MTLRAEAAPATASDAEADANNEGMSGVVWRKMRRNKSAMAGLIIIAILLTSAIFAEWIAPYSYETSAGEGLQSRSCSTAGSIDFFRVASTERIADTTASSKRTLSMMGWPY